MKDYFLLPILRSEIFFNNLAKSLEILLRTSLATIYEEISLR